MAKLRKKKSLGQNFLQDMDVVEKIVDTASIKDGDVVLEVGPGDGVLTQKLLDAGAHVFAMEIDQNLMPRLIERFGDNAQCTILNVDIRRFNIPVFLEERGITDYKVVANLPYYITSSIIRLFLESVRQPIEMVIMVQKEVAERICAAPGAMSVLAVAVQFYGTPEHIFTVSAEAFDPVPKVDSAVIRIHTITKKLSREGEKQFFRIVRAGFSARRKKLVNNLSHSLHEDKDVMQEHLCACGIASMARAQEVTIAQWHDLAKRLE